MKPEGALKIRAALAACALALASAAWAISPAELKRELDKGVKLTVVDVRSTDLYALGHIPGAINIPASLCEAKQLPPLGRVVVYDAGLGVDLAAGAAKAWEATAKQTTRGKGVEREMLPMTTYQQLKTNTADDVVLVDLRKNIAKGKSLSDSELRGEFPQARVVASPFGVQPKKSGGGAPLLVLVDQSDGTAEEMARTLRANGITRFVVLAGGEEIIKRQGQPGLKRSGATISAPVIPGQPAPQPAN
jgi:rhodanese-related sulfurtransferase